MAPDDVLRIGRVEDGRMEEWKPSMSHSKTLKAAEPRAFFADVRISGRDGLRLRPAVVGLRRTRPCRPIFLHVSMQRMSGASPERVLNPFFHPNITFVEDDPLALENVGTSDNVVILNANPRLSAALTLYRLSDHMPEHRSPLTGRGAF